MCDFCDSAYKIGAEMDNHMRAMHPEKRDKTLQKM